MFLNGFRSRRARALQRSGPAEPAGASRPDAVRTRRGSGSVLALRNWPVARRLVLLVTIPAMLGLALAGLWVASTVDTARAYGQVSQLATLGQRVTGLAQALEDECQGAAMYVAGGRPAAGLARLDRSYATTDRRAAVVRGLVRKLDRAQSLAPARASAVTALAGVARLPALRQDTARGPASAVDVINGYSAVTEGLFPIADGIADLSSNPFLLTGVRSLGSLSRLTDQVSIQQAIVGAALAEGRLEPAALTSLGIARAQEGVDLAAFRSSATAQERWALATTLGGPQPRQARAVEQRMIAAGPGALALGPQAGAQWQAGTAYTVGWMRHAGQQLAGWAAAEARFQQRDAVRSAFVAGGVALGALLLTLLIALIIVRSVVRPLRRLETAALDAAQTHLPADIRALAAGADPGRRVLASPVAVSSGGEIGQVARAVGRLHREAVRMAGEEARLRGSADVLVAGFFRRSHDLHDRLLRLIDGMELSEDDPDRLAALFEMDNLATRMRRHHDTALVLASHETPYHWNEPVPLVDVLRAAASEIERYDRVSFDVQASVFVGEDAAVDIVHLLAELLENATTFSPRGAQVVISGFLDAEHGGVLISISDAGPGIGEAQLRWLNWQLSHPRPADANVARQMGMFAVAHLAARHGITVVLTQAPEGGTTAEVDLPAELISPGARPGDGVITLAAANGSAGELPAAEPPAGELPPAELLSAELPSAELSSAELSSAELSSAELPAAELPATGQEALPLPIGAPVPEPDPDDAGSVEGGPERSGNAADGGLPIFDSVASRYAGAEDRAGPGSAEPPAAAPDPG